MKTASQILAGLNEKQKEAVTAPVGPLLIIAGAGSGKTKALTHRVAYLMAGGAAPSGILAVTFTNKAADEMRERIRKLISNQLPATSNQLPVTSYHLPFIGTFHALCAHILRAEYAKIGFRKHFTIFDDDDSLSMHKEVMRALNVSNKQYPAGMIARIISGLKNELILPEDYAASSDGGIFQKTVYKIYAEYQNRLTEANALDFDDLIMKTVLLFQGRNDVLEKYQNRFAHIHVDEFQDTNASQYALIRMLAQKHGSIFVIGDDGQAIYGWRGADWRNIFKFEKDWPGARTIFLEQNYRSTQIILNAANALIARNTLQKKKNLWTKNGKGTALTAVSSPSERHEARFIAEEILRLFKEGEKANDVAVLYRTNAQSRAVEEALIERSLPYVIVGGIKFFQRKEIKDVVSYLRFLQNPSDYVSLKRIINLPPRGIGRAAFLDYLSAPKRSPNQRSGLSLKKFDALIGDLRTTSKESPPSRLIKFLLKKIRYREYLDDGSDRAEERWENVQELVSFAARFDYLGPEDGITKLLEEISLVSYDDHADVANKEKITLMTLHAAKGLEFPCVFITGLEEGILPHAKSFSDASALEEERRLCYVGITRAQKKLYLSWAKRRLFFGELQANVPSRFLKEIPEECVEINNLAGIADEDEYEEDEEFIIE